MAIYEYACPDCESRFEVGASIGEAKARLKPVCPTCGSKCGIRVFARSRLLPERRHRPQAARRGLDPAAAANHAAKGTSPFSITRELSSPL